jgi:hypothetical protein
VLVCPGESGGVLALVAGSRVQETVKSNALGATSNSQSNFMHRKMP